MSIRAPKDEDFPTDGDDRPAGGTSPLSGPIVVLAVLGVAGTIIVLFIFLLIKGATG
jgi:hypothetical protein